MKEFLLSRVVMLLRSEASAFRWANIFDHRPKKQVPVCRGSGVLLAGTLSYAHQQRFRMDPHAIETLERLRTVKSHGVWNAVVGEKSPVPMQYESNVKESLSAVNRRNILLDPREDIGEWVNRNRFSPTHRFTDSPARFFLAKDSGRT